MDNYTGRVLGNRYLLKEIIGVGGMAVVYKAIDNIDNKTVAVKILKDEFIENDDFRRRFKNESRAVAMLSHPNIVKVYDVGFGEKVQYIVMEYIDGITLKEYIQKKGIIDWREAILFTTQILKALQHAHEKGVIHRDIKPQNIMLLRDNRTIKVADFGIARFNNKSDTKTMADGAIGSVHYISPEQARGDIVDNKTDIYSVGVVLYEMITGQLPFQSDSAVSVAIMQMQKEAVMPRKINGNIPVGVEQITMRAMQKSPRDRYQSAPEMLLDIDELRRNPNIRFDYGYFVDKQPTKYVVQEKRKTNQFASGAPVGSDSRVPSGNSTAGTTIRQTVITPETEEEAAEYEAIERRSYVLPVMVGIIFMLIVAIIGTMWYFFSNSDEVTVPNFVGQNIEDIRDDGDYKYFFDHELIEENFVSTKEYSENEIFYQSVEAGKKLTISNSSSSIIKLNIAYTSDTIEVPALEEGIKLQKARSIMQLKGFSIKTESEVDTSVEEGTVLRTDPVAGADVQFGSTITIYYAVADSGEVAVPSVVGEKFSAAKSELEALGFKVIVEYAEAATNKAGLVIEQSIAADTTVVANKTEITIVVGTSSSKTTSVSITLPDLTANGEVFESVYVHVGDSLYKQYSSVQLDGSTHTVELGGSENTTFKIYIGEQLVCSGNVDFTVSVPAVTDKKVSAYKYNGAVVTTAAPTTASTTAPVTAQPTTKVALYTLPSYSGKQYVDYYGELINIGFDNIVKIDKSSETVPEGQIISVSSSKTSYTSSELAGAEIRIYVSTGSVGQ